MSSALDQLFKELNEIGSDLESPVKKTKWVANPTFDPDMLVDEVVYYNNLKPWPETFDFENHENDVNGIPVPPPRPMPYVFDAENENDDVFDEENENDDDVFDEVLVGSVTEQLLTPIEQPYKPLPKFPELDELPPLPPLSPLPPSRPAPPAPPMIYDQVLICGDNFYEERYIEEEEEEEVSWDLSSEEEYYEQTIIQDQYVEDDAEEDQEEEQEEQEEQEKKAEYIYDSYTSEDSSSDVIIMYEPGYGIILYDRDTPIPSIDDSYDHTDSDTEQLSDSSFISESSDEEQEQVIRSVVEYLLHEDGPNVSEASAVEDEQEDQEDQYQYQDQKQDEQQEFCLAELDSEIEKVRDELMRMGTEWMELYEDFKELSSDENVLQSFYNNLLDDEVDLTDPRFELVKREMQLISKSRHDVQTEMAENNNSRLEQVYYLQKLQSLRKDYIQRSIVAQELLESLDDFSLSVQYLLEMGVFANIKELINTFIDTAEKCDTESIRAAVIRTAKLEKFEELLMGCDKDREDVLAIYTDSPRIVDQSIQESFVVFNGPKEKMD